MRVPWFLRGMADRVVTSRWPARTDRYFDDFAVAPAPVAGVPEHGERASVASLCPTGAIGTDLAGNVFLDRGRCIGCGRCVERRPDMFQWRRGSDVAAGDRETLIVGRERQDDVFGLRTDIAARTRALRRSVHIRHVDAGSDGSDEWEVRALLNPVYDVHRLGIFFTASPRHADILLITGIGAPGMILPLARTRAAMPEPVVVVATGTDAISGGLVGPDMGVGRLLEVDVFIPGAPAPPFALLHGILLALGRMPGGPQ